MSNVANIYDNGAISPIAKIRENLSLWTAGQWNHKRVENMEPMPRSAPIIADCVALSGAVTLAANGQIQQQVLAILQPAENEFLHLRWEPLDDVEGRLWEQARSGRFVTRSVHCRVDLFTSTRDPNLSTTTFFILGQQRDMNLEVFNPNPIALPVARFVFWGFRYMLSNLDKAASAAIEAGTKATTWVPAEGF